eukprot:8751444-Alexandrium_andersonii.AAC.1
MEVDAIGFARTRKGKGNGKDGKGKKGGDNDKKGEGKGSGENMFGGKCWYCNKPGHLKGECRKMQRDQKNGKQVNEITTAVPDPPAQPPPPPPLPQQSAPQQVQVTPHTTYRSRPAAQPVGADIGAIDATWRPDWMQWEVSSESVAAVWAFTIGIALSACISPAPCILFLLLAALSYIGWHYDEFFRYARWRVLAICGLGMAAWAGHVGFLVDSGAQ